MLAATFAMTVVRLNEWRINFKPHTATQAAPANVLAHSRINSQRSTSQQLSAEPHVRKRDQCCRYSSKESEDVVLPLRNPKIEDIVSSSDVLPTGG